jgi:Fur family ferric uptake transcriptional regulator
MTSTPPRNCSLPRCSERGMAACAALPRWRIVLKILIAAHQPMNLADIAESPDLTTGADRATVYRLLVKLEERGIIRRLGLHDRSTYYTMLHSDRHDDYLICTACGRIQRLDISCPVEALERDIEKSSGFKKLYHELEFYGLCPQCAG